MHTPEKRGFARNGPVLTSHDMTVSIVFARKGEVAPFPFARQKDSLFPLLSQPSAQCSSNISLESCEVDTDDFGLLARFGTVPLCEKKDDRAWKHLPLSAFTSML